MKRMKLLTKVPLSLAIGSLLAFSGCGGSDESSEETTTVVKLLVRSSSAGSQQVFAGVGNELAAVRALGVAPRSSGCYVLPKLSPSSFFWLIIDVPVDQLTVVRGPGYQSKESGAPVHCPRRETEPGPARITLGFQLLQPQLRAAVHAAGDPQLGGTRASDH